MGRNRRYYPSLTTPQRERAFAEKYLGVSGAENVRLALLRAGQGPFRNLFEKECMI